LCPLFKTKTSLCPGWGNQQTAWNRSIALFESIKKGCPKQREVFEFYQNLHKYHIILPVRRFKSAFLLLNCLCDPKQNGLLQKMYGPSKFVLIYSKWRFHKFSDEEHNNNDPNMGGDFRAGSTWWLNQVHRKQRIKRKLK